MRDQDEELSYEMLQELVRAERRSNKLMPVPGRFWPQVRGFLAAVTAEFRTAQQEDPWSRRAMLLSDEVKNAKHAAENLWALRERKFAMQALAKERHKPEGITADEAQMYHALIETLDSHRRRVFDGTVSAPSTPQPGAASPATPAPDTPAVPAPAAPAPTPPPTGEPSPEVPPGVPPAPRREPLPPDLEAPRPVVVPADQEGEEPIVTVRALSDIPQFVGPDMQTYILKEGDLATLPQGIADLLVRRRKAAVIEEG